MAAPMVKTGETGIFKRGTRYCVVWRSGGRQHKRSARTLKEARQLRASMVADVARGEFDERTKLTFATYAAEWVERYHGNGRGFREHTRTDYRRMLERFLVPWFDGQVPDARAPKKALTLSEIRPRDVSNLVGWLADEKAQAEHARRLARQEYRRLRAEGKSERDPDARERAAREALAWLADKPEEDWTDKDHKAHRRCTADLARFEAKRLADKTIANVVVPLRSCLGTAVQEGLIRHNPTARVKLPHRPNVDEPEDEEREEKARALTRRQLATLLELIPQRHLLLFRFLAATGLRISELVGLQWRHLVLDGSSPRIKVRRAIVRGRVGPPKSKYGHREVPIDHGLVLDLRRWRQETEWPRDTDPVFPSMVGSPLQPGNLRRRVLAPAAEEAGVPWVGFHAFRHSCASLLIADGRNLIQTQRWLGHHSPAFTLSVYGHLLDEQLGEPLDLAAELSGGFKVAPRPRSAGMDGRGPDGPDSAFQGDWAMSAETGRDR